jgi:mRNA interferase MazF
MAAYVPKQGDFVALNFDPQSGHEQQGRRPALVVSKDAFNLGTGMAICCPITSTDRSVPFHVPLAGRTALKGFVMCEQMKSLDFRARKLKFIAAAPLELIEDVLAIIDASIFD